MLQPPHPARRIAAFGAALVWLAAAPGATAADAVSAPESAAASPASAPVTPLTRIADVKTWSDLAGRSLPVSIEGVVTWVGAGGDFFMHDGAMGIHVGVSEAGKTLRPGDRLRVVGATRRGTFAPSIEPRELVRLGTGVLPEPLQASYNLVASGSLDGQCLQIDGVVCAVESQEETEPVAVLNLAIEGRRLRVLVNHPPPLDVEKLIDAEVRVRGVATGSFNPQRQLVEPVLRVSDFSAITVVRPALADPFALPIVPLDRLLGFSLEAPRPHRVRIRGVVARQISERVFFLRDENLGLKVETRVPTTVRSGDVVEATGFPTMSGAAAVMEGSVCRTMSSGAPLVPARPTLAGLLDGSHSSDLVSVQARLVDWVADGQSVTMIFQADNHLLKGLLPHGAGLEALPEKNSIVDATGICVISELEDLWYYSPRSVVLLLSSPADLKVLQAPEWWTRERLWRALALVLAILAAGLGWVWSLRRQVQRKRAVIELQARHAAVLEERSRIARELHDTLEQGLTGFSLQLKAVEKDINDAPDQAGERLQSARQMLRQSRALAHDAIRELRMDAVARRHETLVAGLRRIVDMWNQSGALAVEMRVHGEERPLPHDVEQHLLGIGAEAMTNAVKHGAAASIQLELRYLPAGVLLRVEDNGSGFDPASCAAATSGSFGLLGMRERAHQVGGRIEIRSEPGRGAVILVEVPLGTAAGNAMPFPRPAASTATPPPPAAPVL